MQVFRRGAGVSLLSFLLPSVSQAADVTPSIGIGKRDISAIEPSIEKYLDQRGYTEQVPDINDSVDLEGYWLPFFTADLQITRRRPLLFPRDRLVYSVDISYTSSLFGEEEDSENVPIVYEGTDIGDAKISWEYTLPFYGSLGGSVAYAPLSLQWKFVRLSAAVTGGAGVSYTHVNADLTFNITDNVFYEVMGQQMIAEEFGIAPITKVNADAKGFGGYGVVGINPSVSIWRVEVQGELGYRWEGIRAHVVETTKSLDETVTQTDTSLNASGMTMQASIGFRF